MSGLWLPLEVSRYLPCRSARAHEELPKFLAALRDGKGEGFSIKVPISQDLETEHFWLTDIAFDGEYFTGKIGNEPGMITNVKFGQPWKVRKTEISDWTYLQGGKMHGNYTLRPLLRTVSKEEADTYRSMLAEP
jgi:uncharacterized protein YegJ (DUF2314 family)